MISIQQSLSSAPRPCTEEKFMEIIKSQKVLELCSQIEKITDHDEKSKMKKRLPAFIYQANFPKGKRKQTECVLNGLYMVDFDHVEEDGSWVMGDSGMLSKQAITNHLPPTTLEELKILLVHITPSGSGLRLVAIADPKRGNIADNQQWLADRLNLPLDEACKDATRISFAFPEKNLIYLNPQLFNYDNQGFDKKFGDLYRCGKSAALGDRCKVIGDGGMQGKQATTQQPLPTTQQQGMVINLFKGVSYDNIIAEWWRQQGGEPVEGERNQKLHRLAAHLRYICDNKPERVAEVIPHYGLSPEEVMQLCESACKSRVYQSMPKALQSVLEAVGLMGDGSSVMGDRTMDADVTRKQLEKDFEKLKLPPVLQAVTAGVSPELKVGAVLASLPMFYTLLSRISFDHFDGTESRLSGMTFIVGPAASGKSFIRDLDKLLLEPIRVSDKLGRKQEQDYRDSKELNKNKKDQMAKPHPCIRITPIQISNTMLALRMRDAVDAHNPDLHLHCYSMETELATAIRAQKGGSWIEKNDIYCKAFHNELWGMDYANDQAVNGELQVNLNLVVSGTEDSFDKLIPTNTILSGLPTRLMYYQMPENHFQMLDKKRLKRNHSEELLLRQTSYILDGLSGKVNAKKLTDAMYDWCARMAQRAALEEDHELDDLRKRTALIGARAGVVYAILAQLDNFRKGKPLAWNADVLKFARFVADYTLCAQYSKFAARMREQKQKVAEYAGVRQRPMLLADIYNRLSKNFSLDDLQKLRSEVGRQRNADTCFKWMKRGFIKRNARGNYEKIITVL